MKSFFKQKTVLIIGLLIVLVAGYLFLMPSRTVDFSADVKPILNNKCISCHGGVKAKAGFSVLFRDEALAKTESGKPAIIPGDPGASEMIRRLTVNDPEERMPYKHEPLSKEEIKILKQWIKQGAKWGDHWAYLPVKETELPDVDDPWIRNDVDKFIYAKLKELELRPSVQADKPSLLRRVSLDLIGMYPSEAVAKVVVPKPVTRTRTTAAVAKTATPRKAVTPRKTTTPKKLESVAISIDEVSVGSINQETPEIMKDSDKEKAKKVKAKEKEKKEKAKKKAKAKKEKEKEKESRKNTEKKEFIRIGKLGFFLIAFSSIDHDCRKNP